MRLTIANCTVRGRIVATVWLSLSAVVGAAQPNPYAPVADWLQPPSGRSLGSVSAVDVDSFGHVWLAERCGENSCVGHDELAPVLVFDSSGRWLRGFGAGMFVWPHGIHVDRDGNVWVTDGRSDGARGLQVFKFGPDGRLLLSLGEPGVAGNDATHFSGPTDVVVAPNGDIFVTDGHEPSENNRVVKFDPTGRFITAWGGAGDGPGQFMVPHAIAIDSGGRVFVADRDNNRIQIFSQDGTYLDQWRQFGRPSGIHIGPNDTLYVADNQSNDERNPGGSRGIRVGDARTGEVEFFIPDPDFDPGAAEETSAHGIAADSNGNIYGAEVWSQTAKKYIRR